MSKSIEDPVTSEDIKKGVERLDGRRIVDLNFLGQQLWCTSCKDALSLNNIETERRKRLASILLIRCHKYLLINEILTGKQQSSLDKRSLRSVINYNYGLRRRTNQLNIRFFYV